MHVCYVHMRNDHRSLTLWMLTLCMVFIYKKAQFQCQKD